MFEKSKDRYLTRGVDAEIPLYLQMFLWDAVDNMPQPKDYLQVTYIVEAEKPVTAKVYIIDDGEHCTMLLAEEY